MYNAKCPQASIRIERTGLYLVAEESAQSTTDELAVSFVYSALAWRSLGISGGRVFPSGEEIVEGFAAALLVPLHGISPRETEL